MDYSSIIKDSLFDIARQQEAIILDQLSELLTRGILVVEKTAPVIVGDWDKNRDKYNVELKQKIRLVCKEQEYIEKLEEENKRLKEKLAKFEEILNG